MHPTQFGLVRGRPPVVFQVLCAKCGVQSAECTVHSIGWYMLFHNGGGATRGRASKCQVVLVRVLTGVQYVCEPPHTWPNRKTSLGEKKIAPGGGGGGTEAHLPNPPPPLLVRSPGGGEGAFGAGMPYLPCQGGGGG